MSGIYSFSPFTLLDYPNETACIVWFSGCNLRCLYCHNTAIVLHRGDGHNCSEKKLLEFLSGRRGLLGGVVLSGGEATTYSHLLELAQRIRAMAFKLKLDTNGSRPQVVQELLDNRLLDYIALDYKAPPAKMEQVTGITATDRYSENFRRTLMMVIAYNNARDDQVLGLEIRTTFHPDLMDEDDLNFIIKDLDSVGYRGTYYIQNVVSSGEATFGNIAAPMRRLDESRLLEPHNFTIALRNFPPRTDGLSEA